MGVITTLASMVGLIREGRGVAEAVIGNKKDTNAAEHAEFIAVLGQLAKEFEQPPTSWFDSLINGLNRLPRPALAIGTLGLFVYAMADPVGFAERMVGLELVPDPLWWLLGAVVSFYFGARELHYLRKNQPEMRVQDVARITEMRDRIRTLEPDPVEPLTSAPTAAPETGDALEPIRFDPTDPNSNPALEEWRRMQA